MLKHSSDPVLPRQIPVLSLAMVGVWWVYGIWASIVTPFVVPARFLDLLLSLAIKKAIVFVAVAILLRSDGDSLRSLGFTSADWLRHIGRGMAYAVPIFVLINVALATAVGAVIPRSSVGAVGAITTFFRDRLHLLAWIPIGVIGGGFVEELERAFVLTRFENWLGTAGLYIALGVSSLIFGLGHSYQGASGAIAAGVSGLLFGLVYLRRRSALEAAACHAFADVLGVIAATFLTR